MSFPLFALFATPQIMFPGGPDTALILMRWIHFVAGITWIGLLYFFNLVSTPVMQELGAGERSLMIRKLMPRAMWWFRWSAVVTVLVGLAYWMHIVATDHANALAMGGQASSGVIIGSFFGLWTLAFVVEMGLLMSPAEALRKGPVLGVIVAVVVIAAAWIFLDLNQHGWESNRALGHRHRRRVGLVHAAQRVGHRVAGAEETDSLERSQRERRHAHTARSGQAGAAKFPVARG